MIKKIKLPLSQIMPLPMPIRISENMPSWLLKAMLVAYVVLLIYSVWLLIKIIKR